MKFLKNFILFILSVLNLLLVIVIVIHILNLISTKVLKEDYPKYLDYTYFTSSNTDAVSNIQAGDFILIDLSKIVAEEDIVVYNQNSNYITGKVISKNEPNFMIKNNINESNVNQEQIVGKVTYKIAHLGNIIEMIKKPFTLLIAIVLLILSTMIQKFISKIGKKEGESKPNFKQTW